MCIPLGEDMGMGPCFRAKTGRVAVEWQGRWALAGLGRWRKRVFYGRRCPEKNRDQKGVSMLPVQPRPATTRGSPACQSADARAKLQWLTGLLVEFSAHFTASLAPLPMGKFSRFRFSPHFASTTHDQPKAGPVRRCPERRARRPVKWQLDAGKRGGKENLN